MGLHFGKGLLTASEIWEHFPDRERWNSIYGLLTKCVGQGGWILAKFFFCVHTDRDGFEVHKHAKKERGQYPAILSEQAWSIKDYYMAFREFILAGRGG